MDTTLQSSHRTQTTRLINKIYFDRIETHTVITGEVFALGDYAMKMLYQAITDIHETCQRLPHPPSEATFILPGGRVIVSYDYFNFLWERIGKPNQYNVPDIRIITVMLPVEDISTIGGL